MLVVRKADAELGNKFSALQLWISHVAETWEQPTRGIARRDGEVTVRTDRGRRALTRKELRPMAIQTRRVFREIRDVSERCVALTHFLPVF